jgi:hypothetical protein
MKDEVLPSAQKVASCPHFLWIDIRHREHAASEHGGDLFRVYAVAPGFLAMRILLLTGNLKTLLSLQ